MFAALAERNQKILKWLERFIAIAPVVFMKSAESTALKFLFEKDLTK